MRTYPRRLSLDKEVDTQRKRAHDDNDDQRQIGGAKVDVHVAPTATVRATTDNCSRSFKGRAFLLRIFAPT